MKSSKDVNLDIYNLSLVTAKEDVLNPRTSTNWALFAYDGVTNRLKLADSGAGGVSELVYKLHPRRPLYGLCRVDQPKTAQTHIAMIIWMGKEVDDYRRAQCVAHVPAIKSFFKEVQFFLSASSAEDVTEERIFSLASRVMEMIDRERARQVIRQEDRKETVGTNYKRTIAAAEILKTRRENFWAQAEREEETRKEEERRRAAEDRRQRERERVLQEKREAEERERRMNEKMKKIQEERQLQAQAEAENHKQEQLRWAQQQKEYEEETRFRFSHSESVEMAAEAAALVSQRKGNPREFFRQLSLSSSSDTPPNPPSPSCTVRSSTRRFHRSLTDTFIFTKSSSSSPSSPSSPKPLSPSIPSTPTAHSPTVFSPNTHKQHQHIHMASPTAISPPIPTCIPTQSQKVGPSSPPSGPSEVFPPAPSDQTEASKSSPCGTTEVFPPPSSSQSAVFPSTPSDQPGVSTSPPCGQIVLSPPPLSSSYIPTCIPTQSQTVGSSSPTSSPSEVIPSPHSDQTEAPTSPHGAPSEVLPLPHSDQTDASTSIPRGQIVVSPSPPCGQCAVFPSPPSHQTGGFPKLPTSERVVSPYSSSNQPMVFPLPLGNQTMAEIPESVPELRSPHLPHSPIPAATSAPSFISLQESSLENPQISLTEMLESLTFFPLPPQPPANLNTQTLDKSESAIFSHLQPSSISPVAQYSVNDLDLIDNQAQPSVSFNVSVPMILSAQPLLKPPSRPLPALPAREFTSLEAMNFTEEKVEKKDGEDEELGEEKEEEEVKPPEAGVTAQASMISIPEEEDDVTDKRHLEEEEQLRDVREGVEEEQATVGMKGEMRQEEEKQEKVQREKDREMLPPSEMENKGPEAENMESKTEDSDVGEKKDDEQTADGEKKEKERQEVKKEEVEKTKEGEKKDISRDQEVKEDERTTEVEELKKDGEEDRIMGKEASARMEKNEGEDEEKEIDRGAEDEKNNEKEDVAKDEVKWDGDEDRVMGKEISARNEGKKGGDDEMELDRRTEVEINVEIEDSEKDKAQNEVKNVVKNEDTNVGFNEDETGSKVKEDPQMEEDKEAGKREEKETINEIKSETDCKEEVMEDVENMKREDVLEEDGVKNIEPSEEERREKSTKVVGHLHEIREAGDGEEAEVRSQRQQEPVENLETNTLNSGEFSEFEGCAEPEINQESPSREEQMDGVEVVEFTKEDVVKERTPGEESDKEAQTEKAPDVFEQKEGPAEASMTEVRSSGDTSPCGHSEAVQECDTTPDTFNGASCHEHVMDSQDTNVEFTPARDSEESENLLNPDCLTLEAESTSCVSEDQTGSLPEALADNMVKHILESLAAATEPSVRVFEGICPRSPPKNRPELEGSSVEEVCETVEACEEAEEKDEVESDGESAEEEGEPEEFDCEPAEWHTAELKTRHISTGSKEPEKWGHEDVCDELQDTDFTGSNSNKLTLSSGLDTVQGMSDVEDGQEVFTLSADDETSYEEGQEPDYDLDCVEEALEHTFPPASDVNITGTDNKIKAK